MKIIASDMEIFLIMSESKGAVLWLPNGIKMRNTLIEHVKRELPGYEVISPAICSNLLWKKSGHFTYFKENMFVWEDDSFKPMNCPIHFILAKNLLKMGRALPLTISEYSFVYRKEFSGGINPPLRNYVFTQDDSHVLLTKVNLLQEVRGFIRKALNFYQDYGFSNVKIVLALAKVNNEELSTANEYLKENLADLVHEIKPDDGAFYGPKIELHLNDTLGRSWQCGTIQLDLIAARKFNLKDPKGNEVIVLHRAIMGSVERFIGIMLEQTAGYLPVKVHPKPYVLLIFIPNRSLQEINSNKDIIFVGITQIRRGIKMGKLFKSRLMIFYGQVERTNRKVKVQFYSNQGRNLIIHLYQDLINDTFLRKLIGWLDRLTFGRLA